jgi:peptide/nickel transport system substrate-binding protein
LDGYGFVRGITKIETPDEHTVVITLANADAAFLIKVNGRYSGLVDILPKHLLEGKDWTKADDFLQHPVGTGPYKFESYDGNKVTLVRNDEWFGGKPAFAKIEATVIPDVTLAMKAFENNDLDYLYDQTSSLSEYLRLKNLPGNTGDTYFLFVETLEFNVNKAPFNDVRVREAFTYAIDRNDLNQKIYLGQGIAQVNPSFPDWLTWAVSPDVKLPNYDPAKANQILDDAGYTKGADGIRFTVKISYASPYAPPPEFVDVLKFQLEKVGIKVEHEPNEWDVWWQKVYEQKNFEVSLHHMIVVGDPEIGVTNEVDPFSFYYFGYNNTEVLSMYREAATLTSRTERAEIYAQIQKRLAEDLPYVCLVSPPTADLWKSKFTDILKGDNHRLRFAHEVQAPATTQTTAITTETTEAPPPLTTDYTMYVALAVIVVLLIVGVYAYTKRKQTPKT